MDRSWSDEKFAETDTITADMSVILEVTDDVDYLIKRECIEVDNEGNLRTLSEALQFYREKIRQTGRPQWFTDKRKSNLIIPFPQKFDISKTMP